MIFSTAGNHFTQEQKGHKSIVLSVEDGLVPTELIFVMSSKSGQEQILSETDEHIT
jgi:hypothetical protein